MVGAGSIFLLVVFVILTCGLAAFALVWRLGRGRMRRIERRLQAENRQREETARDMLDTMIQRAQGFLLLFQGFSGELSSHDPMKRRMESVLDEADGWLDETRARVGDWPTVEPIRDFAFQLFRASHRFFNAKVMHFSALTTGVPRLLVQSVADDLFRIGIEALTNAQKHAHASNVEVDVDYEAGRFRLRVRDDGCGLNLRSLPRNSTPHRVGLQGIRDETRRMGGHFRMWSRPSAGTEIEVVIPASRAYRQGSAAPLWNQALIFPRSHCWSVRLVQDGFV